MKPGPKPGWAARLREQAALHHQTALHHYDMRIEAEHSCDRLECRIDRFNNLPFWSKVLFLLKGGQV